MAPSHRATQSVKLPPFEATPLDEVRKMAATARATFKTGKTKDVQWRLVQLRKLYWGINDLTPQILEALKQDLNKCAHDAFMSEIGFVTQDVMFTIQNLEKWAKDDTNVDVPLHFSVLKPRIRKEPYGAALIIGTYNLPFQLNICPFIGAISAGCTAVVKPSEHAPATAMVIRDLVEKYLDPTAYMVVNGAIPETSALLDEKWDKIFYTGGVNVAKIISKKAAEHLTPVTLELGGKNPAFVSKNFDLYLAARRLLWGKTMNAGQVCISHNYALVEREVVDEFIKQLNVAYNEFFPKGPKASPDYARIINEAHFDRMKKMLDNTKGKIVMGGDTDRDELYIAPTAVLTESPDDSMIQEESFGPIWAIVPYDNVEDAIELVNNTDPTPLSLMTFGNKNENDKILNNITSGGATMNDAWMHGSLTTVPFGGVGTSGTGAYRGKHSFACFSHHRTIAQTPTWMDKLLRVRYMPYLESELKQFRWLNGVKPDFDRNGQTIRGVRYWMWMIFGLGGPSVKGALLRWLVVLASGYAAVSGLNLKRLGL